MVFEEVWPRKVKTQENDVFHGSAIPQPGSSLREIKPRSVSVGETIQGVDICDIMMNLDAEPMAGTCCVIEEGFEHTKHEMLLGEYEVAMTSKIIIM